MSEQQIQTGTDSGVVCELRTEVDMRGIDVLSLTPASALPDYRAAMQLANQQAEQRLGELHVIALVRSRPRLWIPATFQ